MTLKGLGLSIVIIFYITVVYKPALIYFRADVDSIRHSRWEKLNVVTSKSYAFAPQANA